MIESDAVALRPPSFILHDCRPAVALMLFMHHTAWSATRGVSDRVSHFSLLEFVQFSHPEDEPRKVGQAEERSLTSQPNDAAYA